MLAIRCPHICKLAIYSTITSSQAPTSRVTIYSSVMTSLQTNSPTPAFSHKVDVREFVESSDELIRGHVRLTLDLIWLGGGGCWTIARVEGACALWGGGGLWPWRSMCALALTRIVPVLAGKRLGAIWYDIRDSPFISLSDLRPTAFHPSLYL